MVDKIEQYEGDQPIKKAEPARDGLYHCYPEGQSVRKFRSEFKTLDEVAHYLTQVEPRGRVRMNPGWAMIADGIYIDEVPREKLKKP